MSEIIKKAAGYIQSQIQSRPEIAIILGTGLGNIVDDMRVDESILYGDIPGFPLTTAPGHKGRLLFGKLSGKSVMVMQGRFHFYEGHTMEEVIFPIRVMKFLGIKKLLISNASGGVNPDFEIGDLMIITDHINMMPNPLIGKNDPDFGDRFPDMSEAYDPSLVNLAEELARVNKISVKKGVYVGVTGPTLETPAEYMYFRIIGGDTIGMSTVPEVIAAHQMGIKCLAVSIITDLGVPGKIVKVSLNDVEEAAGKAGPLLLSLMEKVLEKL